MTKGTEITGATVGGALGLFGGQVGAVAGGAVGVLTAQLLNEIIERQFSERQKIRVAATSTFIFDGIAKRLEAGEFIRDDGFFENTSDDRSNAEEIFEGTLIKCAQQFQEKKIKFISKIFEKTAFDKSISEETANQFLVMADNLTYRKLALLSFYGRCDNDFNDVKLLKDPYVWYPNIDFTTNEKLLLQDLFELVNLDLLNNETAMFSNRDIIPDKVSLTETGIRLFEIMDLWELEDGYILKTVEGLKYKEEWGVSTNGSINGVYVK